MKKRKKKNYYATYKNTFERLVRNGENVTGCKYDTPVEEKIKLEDYRQCYDPHFKPRKELPKYWFISMEGFLISVKGENLKFIKPNLGQHRPQFTFNNGKGRITAYGLVGLVWGSYIDPDAYELMDKYGVKCIGKNDKEDKNGKIKAKVQAHHTAPEGYLKEKTLENYIHNNRPEFIQFITNKAHRIVEGLTGETRKDLEMMMESGKKYADIPTTRPMAYQYEIINTVTGQVTKEKKVLEEEALARYNLIPIGLYETSGETPQKMMLFGLRSKEDKDKIVYDSLPGAGKKLKKL